MKYNYYDDLDELKNNKYYHGTSDKLIIKDNILLPSNETAIIREQKLNKVFITTSYGSAKKYAIKASNKFGGNPIIYRVIPDYHSLIHRMDFEYICDFATIMEEFHEN